jgi:hypothetical protein
MATTTNFGWTTPDNTDLVKNGALAIRTLGSAIDTSLVDLKGGTTGQVLTKSSGTDMDFTWAAAGGSGKVLQVVQATYATAVNTSSTSYQSTGLSASITPSSTSSKIYINVTQMATIQASDRGAIFTIFRGTTSGTDLSSGNSAGISYPYTATGGNSRFPINMQYVDSPSTTSSTTYTSAVKSDGNGQIGTSGSFSVITLWEIGA